MNIKKLAGHGISVILGSWLISVALLAGCAAQPGNAPAATPMAAAEILPSSTTAVTPQPEPTPTSEPTATPTETPEPTPEPEAAPSWLVYTAEELASLPAEELAKLRTNARFVMGVDKLDDAQFVEQMGGRIARVTTTANDSERTNTVIIDGQTDLEQLQAAITAAREQGLNLIGTMALYVTHDSDGVMRVWHEGTISKTAYKEWLVKSYGSLTTLMGFFTYSPETGKVTLQDLSRDNYQLLGMGTIHDLINKRIRGPAAYEYKVIVDENGTASVIVFNGLNIQQKFVDGEWVNLALPHMRSNGEAEVLSTLEKVNAVLAKLDAKTSQSSDPKWYEAELKSYKGSTYLEVLDTSENTKGRVAYLVYVELDETTGERRYGPVILRNSNNFNPNSTQDEVLAHQPIESDYVALETVRAIGLSTLARQMGFNNIGAVTAYAGLSDTHLSSHTATGVIGRNEEKRFDPLQLIHFNLKKTKSESEIFLAAIGEFFELMGDSEFFEGEAPPLSNFFYILDPRIDLDLIKSDNAAVLLNSTFNFEQFLIENKYRLKDLLDDQIIESHINTFAKFG